MTSVPDADWVHRYDAALRASGPAGGPLCIAHRIGGDGDTFEYHVLVDADGSRAVVGAAPDPTITFRLPVDVAAAIRSGDLAAGDAVLLGQVEVAGDIAALLAHRHVLAGLEAAATRVR